METNNLEVFACSRIQQKFGKSYRRLFIHIFFFQKRMNVARGGFSCQPQRFRIFISLI